MVKHDVGNGTQIYSNPAGADKHAVMGGEIWSWETLSGWLFKDKTMKIFKYELPNARGVFRMPMDRIQYTTHVQVVGKIPYMWACVDDERPQIYTIRAIHTGDNTPDMDEWLRIGTAVLEDGAYVLHYFRQVE